MGMKWTSKDQALYNNVVLGLKSLREQGWISNSDVKEILNVIQRGIDKHTSGGREDE